MVPEKAALINYERPFPPIEPTEKSMRALAAAVVCQAVDDWTTLIRWGGATGTCNFDEIRHFFKDGFGEMLCDHLNLDSGVVLAKLEDDLKKFHNYGILPRRYNLRNDVSKN